MTNPEAAPQAAVQPPEDVAATYGLQYLPVVPETLLDTALVARLPVDWARSHCLLPVRIEGAACVLTADPSQVTQQEDLALLVGQELRPVMAPREEILRSIERCYYSRDDTPGEFMEELQAPVDARVQDTRGDDLLMVAETAPVTQLVNLILLQAVKQHASDIHFEPFESRLRVRYRVDGTLYEQTSPPKHLENALVSRLKVMGRMDIAEKRLPQDGMARVRVGEREIDIRVSTVPVPEGERVVLRLLDQETALLPLDTLGMPGDIHRQFDALLQQPNGIVVVSGPTGSGKTTTLYAALGTLDSSRRNIMTIEDPIEYQVSDIGQIQVKPKIGLTFAIGLRHILRQDPDVVLVGETRDLETAEIAVRASLTGHLVFTTLHTNDAPSAVMRLVDMGVEPYLLAASLRGVLAQRLVRCLCPVCRVVTAAAPDELAAVGPYAERLAGAALYGPRGCDRCLEGYTRRTGLFELMCVNRELAGAIRSGAAVAEALGDLAVRGGMRGLLDNGVDKVLAGVTSLAEVISVASA